jgi:hypothetical protein
MRWSAQAVIVHVGPLKRVLQGMFFMHAAMWLGETLKVSHNVWLVIYSGFFFRYYMLLTWIAEHGDLNF